MKKITLIALSLPFLSACSPSMPEMPEMPEMPSMSKLIPDISLPKLFKSDVNQGSVLDRFNVNQLKIGMSKTEVQNLIGSPSVTDPFHNSQWDYINHSTLYKKDDINYRLTLIFDKNILKNIDTSKLSSLPPLTEKEQELENARIAKEKIISDRTTKAKSQADAKKAVAQAKALKEKQAAQAKAKAIADKKAADEAKALTEKRAADEEALKKKQAVEAAATREADLKEGYEMYEKAAGKAKSLKGPNTPWYRFW